MLEDCKDAKERWGGVSNIVDRWLQERQAMLVEYCALSPSDKTANEQEKGSRLRRLCQILVDYVSAGHFEIYDQLIREGKEFGDQQALREAHQLYEQVDNTTERLLDFNDKYLETDDLSSLERDLSELGETLETRFDAEDRMIQVLHTAHQDMIH